MRHFIRNARLPRWLLPQGWPEHACGPALAAIEVNGEHFSAPVPETPQQTPPPGFDLRGALVLPGLVEAHTHLDKALTRSRLGALQPGLLAAITAMQNDRRHWSNDDVRARAERSLTMAAAAGVTRLRTHVDWWSTDAPPAWQVLGELAAQWRQRIRLERVALVPLPLFESAAHADAIAAQVKRSGDAILGGFIHTSNYNAQAVAWLLDAAAAHALDLDLHVDEELDPQARGLEHVVAHVRQLREQGYAGRVVCGHVCALAAREDEAQALALLDDIAQAGIVLMALPATNLLLQDASTGRTPRRRGLTLIKEARARGIPVMVANDNVQDAFCPLGKFDPVEALHLAVLAAQLDDAFDVWSQAICRSDWLDHQAGQQLSGATANTANTVTTATTVATRLLQQATALLVFPDADPYTWPASSQRRVMRANDFIRSDL